ncbi:hypothetical protein F4810DRAFT_219577 [Camillea tinctor]|nr:hypothetical protein F4810DRAFT_219577 [Camillea tinctor]
MPIRDKCRCDVMGIRGETAGVIYSSYLSVGLAYLLTGLSQASFFNNPSSISNKKKGTTFFLFFSFLSVHETGLNSCRSNWAERQKN